MKSLISVIGDIILFFIFTCILIIPCLVLLNLVPSVNSAKTDSHIAQDIAVFADTEESSSESSVESIDIVTSTSRSSENSNIISVSTNSVSASKLSSNSSSALSSISSNKSANSSLSTSTSQARTTSTVSKLQYTDEVKLSDKIILENKSISTAISKYNFKITDIAANVTQVVQLGKFVNTSNSPIEVKIKIADYLSIFDKSTITLKTDTLTYKVEKLNDEITIMINPKEETYVNLTMKTIASMRNEKFSLIFMY